MADPIIPKNATHAEAFTKEEKRKFMELLPDLVRDLTYEGAHQDLPDINKHLAKVRCTVKISIFYKFNVSSFHSVFNTMRPMEKCLIF